MLLKLSAWQHFSLAAFQLGSISAWQHFSLAAFQLGSISACGPPGRVRLILSDRAVYNAGAVKLLSPENLCSASTARTYPVGTEKLLRAIEEAVQSLPGWTLAHTS